MSFLVLFSSTYSRLYLLGLAEPSNDRAGLTCRAASIIVQHAPMPIETERLILRLFGEKDYTLLRELDADPVVLNYRSRPLITAEMTRQFLDFAQRSIREVPRTYFAYAIETKPNHDSTGRTWLGQCGLTAIPEKATSEKSFYLWYSLLPRYWGQGYMTEAVQALIQLGFNKFGLKSISAESDPENIASYRVMEKAGLQYTGIVLRQDAQGKKFRRVQYEITYPDFLKASWPPVKIVDSV